MKRFNLILLVFIYFLLSSCLSTVATVSYFDRNKYEEPTKEQQQEVKKAIVPILEKEYKQPFKLLSFDYKHKVDFDGRDLKTTEYGKYYFKVQAVDNPIIIMNFDISDFATKESIKPLIDSFKKNQLNGLYCGIGLVDHYLNTKRTLNDKLTPEEIKANNYCDSIGQKSKYDNAWTR
ncbi:hypothetical protein IBE48_05505 [Francisella philomiragia]|uniref:Lipoprotein n=1 Tax=Francisella philomiragia TaxID=28110 RepID=A0AAW3DCF9_9GAMM|nr:hypothetical protein [Francisella philomiragia]KFJ43458.1 putative lipoprotein [Francisella philomiragia]MBK2255496.1 hypothetical protein [Francisella philomiragia]MBK2273848.1 hypothetical protein [Francisella philomiragia]MBK2277188.1 hypothetical protein [Francisella philomiragia]MBK2281107.1 hypothetical protein [Francisella philomiragia]